MDDEIKTESTEEPKTTAQVQGEDKSVDDGKAQDDKADAKKLSDEWYEQYKSGTLDWEAAAKQAGEIVTTTDTGAPEIGAQSTTTEEKVEPEVVVATDGTIPKVEQPPIETPPPAEVPYREEIIVDGQAITITDRGKARNLMQQGWDYSRKVGHHARLAQVLDARPDLGQKFVRMIQDELAGGSQQQQAQPGDGMRQNGVPQQQAGFDFRPTELTQDKEPEQWLSENLANFGQTIIQQVGQYVAQQRQQPVQQDPVQVAHLMLQTHDPQHWSAVTRHFPKYFDDMSQKNIRLLNQEIARGNYAPLLQFYDNVKKVEKIGSVAAPVVASGRQTAPPIVPTVVPQASPPAPRPQPKTPSFRVRSGSGPVPGGEVKKVVDVWSIPDKEFKQQLARLKALAV